MPLATEECDWKISGTRWVIFWKKSLFLKEPWIMSRVVSEESIWTSDIKKNYFQFIKKYSFHAIQTCHFFAFARAIPVYFGHDAFPRNAGPVGVGGNVGVHAMLGEYIARDWCGRRTGATPRHALSQLSRFTRVATVDMVKNSIFSLQPNWLKTYN